MRGYATEQGNAAEHEGRSAWWTAIVLTVGAGLAVLASLLDEPWHTNTWDWTLPVSIGAAFATGTALGRPWAYGCPLVIVVAHHLTYEVASRDGHSYALDELYVLAEIVLVVGLYLAARFGVAVRTAARRRKA